MRRSNIDGLGDGGEKLHFFCMKVIRWHFSLKKFRILYFFNKNFVCFYVCLNTKIIFDNFCIKV